MPYINATDTDTDKHKTHTDNTRHTYHIYITVRVTPLYTLFITTNSSTDGWNGNISLSDTQHYNSVIHSDIQKDRHNDRHNVTTRIKTPSKHTHNIILGRTQLSG